MVTLLFLNALNDFLRFQNNLLILIMVFVTQYSNIKFYVASYFLLLYLIPEFWYRMHGVYLIILDNFHFFMSYILLFKRLWLKNGAFRYVSTTLDKYFAINLGINHKKLFYQLNPIKLL